MIKTLYDKIGITKTEKFCIKIINVNILHKNILKNYCTDHKN